MQLAPAPQPLAFNTSMLGPVLYNVASEEQKKYYLPRIANLDDWWCQGFSEPGAGSDLASLKTKAERKGDVYVVNGQKTWTTLAQNADMIFCLVRTDPNAKNRQSGISFLLIDMKSRGITVRPIVTIDGGREVNEVFFDNVEVPVANLVGQENKGWDYAQIPARQRAHRHRPHRRLEGAAAPYPRARCRGEVGGKPIIEDPRFLEKLTAVEIELKALEMNQMRVVAAEKHREKGKPDPASSILKIKGSELQQATTELMMEVIGPFAAALRVRRRGRLQRGRGVDHPDRAELLQLPQGLDLRRFERNSAQHHRQGGAGAVNGRLTCGRPRERGDPYRSRIEKADRLDCFVIASEAKQSSPSLRHLDCFVAGAPRNDGVLTGAEQDH